MLYESIEIAPWNRTSMPAKTFNKVVFPAPDGEQIHIFWFLSILKDKLVNPELSP